jgi:hypothetical protein
MLSTGLNNSTLFAGSMSPQPKSSIAVPADLDCAFCPGWHEKKCRTGMLDRMMIADWHCDFGAVSISDGIDQR